MELGDGGLIHKLNLCFLGDHRRDGIMGLWELVVFERECMCVRVRLEEFRSVRCVYRFGKE